jgi:integrase
MFKNVSLRSRTLKGRLTWILLGPDGIEIAAFSAYAFSLRHSPKNTLDSYCRHLADFLDFLIEVSAMHTEELTKSQLCEAIEAYGDYLKFGVDSGNEVARAVAARKPPGSNASTSLVPKLAAIRRFLRLSDDIRKEMADMARVGGRADGFFDDKPLLPELGKLRELQPFEIRAMQANSMLAGVIAGGPKFIDSVVLRAGSVNVTYQQSRAFPYDKVMELIDAMPSYRDEAIYSLLAACGGRIHEVLQLLFEDIDVVEGTVLLVDPETRANHSSYRALSVKERQKLAWKGRSTQLTLLVEPFASRFFESLKRYFEYERIAHGRDEFVFQYLSGAMRGRPYFLSAPASRVPRFHIACSSVGVALPRGTAGHSLRGMYGTYLLNYFPRANGDYGLPAPLVQQLMGHSSIKNTFKYARYDQDLLKLELENASRVLFSNGAPKKLSELKLAALESQIKQLRSEVSRETPSA